MGSIAVSAGTTSSPAVRFKEEINSGLFRPDSGRIGETLLGVQISDRSGTTAAYIMNSGDTAGFERAFKKSRGTQSSPALVNTGDTLGKFGFYGYDGSTYYLASEIRSKVEATAGAESIYGGLYFYTGGPTGQVSERLKIAWSGRVGINSSTDTLSGIFHVASNDPSLSTKFRFFSSTDQEGMSLEFDKSRHGTIGSHTIVQSSDILGTIYFKGSDGANYIPAGSISCVVDSTPGTNDMPGRLVFSTTADGAYTLSERMRISNAGYVGIGATAPFCGLDCEKSVGDTYGKFGNSLPLYAVSDANGASWGFNAYYSSGWKFGKGSSSKYGGILSFETSNNIFNFYGSSATGNADASMTVVSFAKIGRGSYTFPKGAYASSYDSGTGFLLRLNYNVTDNKQLLFGDPDYLGNSAGTFIRIPTVSGLSYIDCNNGDNTAQKALRFMATGGIYMSAANTNTFSVAHDTNSEYDLWINYNGYQDSNTQYRTLKIGDGKQKCLATFRAPELSCATLEVRHPANTSFGVVLSLYQYQAGNADPCRLHFFHAQSNHHWAIGANKGTTYKEFQIAYNASTASFGTVYWLINEEAYVYLFNSGDSSKYMGLVVNSLGDVIMSSAGGTGMEVLADAGILCPNLNSGAGSYTAKVSSGKEILYDTSDVRMKDNFGEMLYGLKEVLAIIPKFFRHYNSEKAGGELVRSSVFEESGGFVAQEVYAIAPRAVYTPEEGLWNINDRMMLGILWKGVQELNTARMADMRDLDLKVGGIRNELDTLRKENESLKERLVKLEEALLN